jgi:hypothetical protein
VTWWETLDAYLAQLDASDDDAPDPWGGLDLDGPLLTDGQLAYLGFDQPAVPRLGGLRGGPAADAPASEAEPGDGAGGGNVSRSGEGTGNSPGDA